MKEKLARIAAEKGIPFERALLEYVKELLLSAIYEKGFGDSLWLCDPKSYGEKYYRLHERHRLVFFYRESQRVLPRDGFVSGCAFDAEFPSKFFLHVLSEEKSLLFEEPAIDGTVMKLNIRLEEMFVPAEIEIVPLHEENITPIKTVLRLPLTKREYEIHTFPAENEAAFHMGEILSKLSLLTEMEHYLYLYLIFLSEAVEGVRFQAALEGVLKQKGILFSDENMDIVLKGKNDPYMRKKWKNLVKRQRIESLSWDEVIDILSFAVLPIWEASQKNEVFFGDWMPEIKRYLD